MKIKTESDRNKILLDTDSFFRNGGKMTECVSHKNHIEHEIAFIKSCHSITNNQKARQLSKLEIKLESENG